MTMTPSVLLTFLAALAWKLRIVQGAPYFLLQNKAPKCFQVNAPANVKLTIKYHVPDILILDDFGSGENADITKEGKNEFGMDTMYNDRLQKRIESLKRAKMKDIHITVTPRDSMGALLTKRNSPDANIPVKHREQLELQEGLFFYDTGDLDGGNLEICIQSYTASMETPSRVALSVSKHSAAEDDIIQELEADRAMLNRRLESENKIIKEETSRITAELMRMQRRAKSIAGDAQFSKKREENFHNQSLALNRAVKIWPIVRMIVVMIGGYLQVSHVIAYMKSRHIC